MLWQPQRRNRLATRDAALTLQPRTRTRHLQTAHVEGIVAACRYRNGSLSAGLGASHQTGWTGLVAKLIDIFGRLDGSQLLDAGKTGSFVKKGPTADKKVA